MKTIGAYEAKTRLSRILEDVREGESFAITKHGVTVALLIPAEARPDVEATVRAVRAFRAGKRLGKGLAVGDLVREGRRR
jgi:prevent-host-death family protein